MQYSVIEYLLSRMIWFPKHPLLLFDYIQPFQNSMQGGHNVFRKLITNTHVIKLSDKVLHSWTTNIKW